MTDILTSNEMDALIMALAKGAGDDGFTKGDAETVVAWAETVRLGTVLLRFVLDGDVTVIVKDGEVQFAASKGSNAESFSHLASVVTGRDLGDEA